MTKFIHKHILITGPSATGKTYLSNFFKEKGKTSYDADEVIARFVDKKTGKPREPTKHEWKNFIGIEWKWDRKKLKKILKNNNEVYIFGSADNLSDFISLFDKVYYLYRYFW